MTHDYREKYWGHDYVWKPENRGTEGSLMGWGHGINKGDYIILKDAKPQGSRYKFTSIKYFLDPRDMWSGRVKFAPRSPKQVERYEKQCAKRFDCSL